MQARGWLGRVEVEALRACQGIGSTAVITRRDRPLAVGQTPACLTSDALELEARSPSTVAVSSFVGASTALEVAVRPGLPVVLTFYQ